MTIFFSISEDDRKFPRYLPLNCSNLFNVTCVPNYAQLLFRLLHCDTLPFVGFCELLEVQ